MVATEVTVANVKTMADRSIRITLDLQPGTKEEFAEAYRLMSEECLVYLGTKKEFE